jgi:hypothetical protein
MGQMRNTYNIVVGKPEGKRPLERPRRRWKDNIRIAYLVALNVKDTWKGDTETKSEIFAAMKI